MHGGKRQGAGRKVGAVTKKTREVAEAAATSGLTPLDYMLSILRDDTQPAKMRFEAATAAAPYCHAKLAAVTVGGDPNAPLCVVTKIELVAPGHDDSKG